MKGLLFLAVAGGVLSADAAVADGDRPLFDAHVHYSRPAWEEVKPKDVFTVFDHKGVDRALVSSTPDVGTLRLKTAEPKRVVAFVRPYRTRADMQTWHADPSVLAYVKERLDKGGYAGIGEFHLYDPAHADTPEIKELVNLAVERDLYLHAHSDAAVIDALFAINPKVKIVWAHAGMTDPAEVVGATMDKYANLWADMSFREWDVIAPDDTNNGLDPAWEKVLLRHSDRFMYGSDTYITERWFDYERIVDDHRKYLKRLPADVADAIAFGNARRLFPKPTGD